MTDPEKARQLLSGGGYTCVLCHGEQVYTSSDRGVKPLVRWIESETDVRGFSAADKVVGKGAAFLYLLMGVRHLYADVISAPALSLLQSNGIAVTFTTQAAHIINRQGDGICPFELAVMDIDDRRLAYAAICDKMKQMNISTD